MVKNKSVIIIWTINTAAKQCTLVSILTFFLKGSKNMNQRTYCVIKISDEVHIRHNILSPKSKCLQWRVAKSRTKASSVFPATIAIWTQQAHIKQHTNSSSSYTTKRNRHRWQSGENRSRFLRRKFSYAICISACFI